MRIKNYSREMLDRMANRILYDYEEQLLYDAKPIPIEELVEFHYGLNLEFCNFPDDTFISGLTVFSDGTLVVLDENGEEVERDFGAGTIVINSEILRDDMEGYYKFTLAHELSHWILHKYIFEDSNIDIEELMKKKLEKKFLCFGNIDYSFLEQKKEIQSDYDWLEWQANNLAAHILVPTKLLHDEFLKILDFLQIKQRYIYVDRQRCNARNGRVVQEKLSRYFGVSKSVIRYKLKNLNLWRDNFERMS